MVGRVWLAAVTVSRNSRPRARGRLLLDVLQRAKLKLPAQLELVSVVVVSRLASSGIGEYGREKRGVCLCNLRETCVIQNPAGLTGVAGDALKIWSVLAVGAVVGVPHPVLKRLLYTLQNGRRDI